MKKIIFLSVVFAILSFSGESYSQNLNYGEALQKSMFFYEAQRSGSLPSENRVSWRSNACEHDGSVDGIDLSGGWFDAGDHVKFNFPMSYSVTTMCWGAIEFPDGYKNSNQYDYFKSNIRWVTDYLLKCHTAPHELYGQVGDGATDHAFWIPAEMVELSYARNSYKIDETHPGSDLAGETAAALASASIIFKDSDPTYSAILIKHAKQIYEFADNFRGVYSTSMPQASAFYKSYSGYQDELCWGAIWLYLATNDVAYLDKAKLEYKSLSNEAYQTVRQYGWTIAWDDKSYGCYVLMSKILGDVEYKTDTERWLNQWFTSRPLGNGPGFTSTGFPVLSQWGSSRYAANTALGMLIYAKYVGDKAKATKYHDRAKWVIDYLLGKNPVDTSYVIGFGKNYPQFPHHRTAHGSWNRDMANPTETRHILYGALVGGLKSKDDFSWTDARTDYISNEVATDYNACFSGCLAALTQEYGGTPLADFPQKEIPKGEFMVETKINNSGANYTEYSIWVNNRTAWPARVPNLSFRIFLDLTEGFAKGYKLTDYTVSAKSSSVTSSGLLPLDATKNLYYIEIKFLSTIQIYPAGQSQCRKETQVRISMSTKVPAGSWDSTNDWSYSGMTTTLLPTDYIPLYANGILVAGKEPSLITNYTISASAATGGIISPSGIIGFSQGSNQSFTISANSGYKVSDVLVDSISQGAISTYTFSNIVENHSISVIMQKIDMPVSNVYIVPSSISMAINATSQLNAVVIPAIATNSKISWSSDNSSIATVDSTGLVTGKTLGNTIITVTTQDGHKTGICNVTVCVPVTDINITPATLTVAVKTTSQLLASVSPSNASNQKVSWSSSNTTIATVDSTGLITTVAKGTATITATSLDGGNKSSTCALTVVVPVTGVTISPATVNIEIGATTQLTATIAPADASNKNIFWRSSNAAIASVVGGLVTGIASGTATIFVRTKDGDIITSSTVFVGATALDDISDKKSVIIYPNPIDKTSALILVSEFEGQYLITEISGRKVLSGELTAGKNYINLLSKINSGIYFIAVQSGAYKSDYKLIIK